MAAESSHRVTDGNPGRSTYQNLIIVGTILVVMLSAAWILWVLGWSMALAPAGTPLPLKGVETIFTQSFGAAAPPTNQALRVCDGEADCSWQRCLYAPISSDRVELLRDKLARLCLGVAGTETFFSAGLAEVHRTTLLANTNFGLKMMTKLWYRPYMLRR